MMKLFADRLFRWFCHPDYYPDIKGDLEELYSDHLLANPRTATLKYLKDVLLLFRISLLRPLFQNSIMKDTGMLKNYFKISIRSLTKHKLFTTINVIGLAVGLAGFLLIYEYIQFEQTYDGFHPKADQLYRVSYVMISNGEVMSKDAMSSYSVGQVLEGEVPEVLVHTVSKKFDELIIRNGDRFFRERSVITADEHFLKLFNYGVLQGDRNTMLSEPKSIVLTESRAQAYFGESDPVGKALEVTGDVNATFKVTGVIQDIPDNTHYHFDMMVSDKTLEGSQDYGNWNYNNYYVYIRVAEGVDIAELADKANDVTYTFMNGEDRNRKSFNQLDIHSVQGIHLDSDFTFEPQLHGSKRVVSFLLAVSVFILIIAWVNYINLSTARAADRAKEVGIRKVIGAFKMQLIFQFLCEALLVNLIGAVVALALAEWSIPFFNQLVGKNVVNHVWDHLPFLKNLMIFTAIGIFVSGFYPAVVLSGFKPIAVLKGKFNHSSKGVFLRKFLVTVQFAASLILISATLIIYLQVNYMRSKDIGVSLDYVVNVYVPEGDMGEEEQRAFNAKLQAFKDQLKDHHSILAVGAASNLPGGEAADINSTSTQLSLEGLTEPERMVTYAVYVDEGFVDAVGMQLVAGRNFNRKMKSDSNVLIVNESFMRRFNLPDIESLVGEKVNMWGEAYLIIGVVKDFNRTSLRTEIEPTIYIPWMEGNNLVVKLNAANYQEGMGYLEALWKEYYPNATFDYIFLDERFAQLYDQDQKFGDTFLVFASLAILIALLGLYGLASFLSLQRAKEVGVRKVLGASVLEIIFLFYRNFLVLLGISGLLGFPISYYLMNHWLDGYAFRVDFPWLMLLVSLVVVLLFALGTVAFQVRKVAVLNPAKTLKYE